MNHNSTAAEKEIRNWNESIKNRFWSKVEKSPDPDGCWIWKACKSSSGYGNFSYKRAIIIASRASFILNGGVFTEGPCVIHGPCNNPACVNPNHLSSGTHKKNMEDKKRDGTESYLTGDSHWTRLKPEKIARGDKSGARTKPESRPRGSKHGNSKLKENDIIAIREKYAAGGILQRELAEDYGVNQTLIGFIVRRVRWQHVT